MDPDHSLTDTVTVAFGSAGESQSSATAELPRRLGHVTLVEQIGQGGMGVVWRGRDELLKRDVAVKFFRRPEFAADPILRTQFIEGAQAAAVIKHANVVSIYHADEIDGVIYIVMEHVDGCTLRAVLSEEHHLEPRLAALVVGKVLEALAAIHAAQVIHRDLKPANVMFDSAGALLVSDFGLSYQRKSGPSEEDATRGTPPYMAPEVFEAEGSFQSDIYAVGVLYYELLTGVRPFKADSVTAYYLQHLTVPLSQEPLDRAGIADAVRDIILRATNKKKIFRYKSAAHMLKAVADAHPGLLTDRVLDSGLRELVRVGTPRSQHTTTSATPESPTGTYFDLLSQRADAKRQRKQSDSGELQ